MPQLETDRITKPGLAVMCLAVSIVVSTYFFFPCHRYFVNGLIYAIAIRDNISGWLLHPHHIIYPLVPQMLYLLVSGRSSGMNELEFLTIISMIAGALASWGVLMALRAGSMSVTAAIIGMGFFSFTRAVWYFAVTPNQNVVALALQIFALLVMVIALRRTSGTPSRRSLWTVAVLTALAVFGSQINIGLLLPGAYIMICLFKDSPRRVQSREIARLIIVTVLIILTVTVIAGIAFGGFRAPVDFLHWQHSYVSEARWWARDFQDAVRRGWVGVNSVWVAYLFEPGGLFGNWIAGFGSAHWFVCLLLRLSQAYVLLFLLVETVRAIVSWIRTREIHPMQVLGALFAAAVMLLSCVWAPESSNYRVLYVPGVILFLTPWLERRYRLDEFRFRRAWPVILALAALIGVNFMTQFLPMSDPSRNPYHNEVFKLSESVKEGDLIIYSGSDEGRLKSLYARYFVDCETMLAPDFIKSWRENPEQVIATFVAKHDAGYLLFIHEDAVNNDADIKWMNENYNADLHQGEIFQLLQTWAEPLGPALLINRKRYFVLTPRQTDRPGT